jgi:hypothetical protein
MTVRERGKIRTPTFDGENAKIFWRKKGATKVCAALIQKERRLVPREEMKSLLLKTLRSTRGKGDRSSEKIKKTKQARVRENHANRRSAGPSLTRLRNRRRNVTKQNMRKAPQRSNRTSLVRCFLSKNFEVIKIAIAPIGRLTKKTDRHPICSTKNPPRIGPVKNPAETTEPTIPNAWPRSLSGKAVVIIAGPMAMRAEAPNPWIILEPIRKWTVGEKPQRAEPKVKVLRPKR